MEIIAQGGHVYPVPRSVMAEGGDAVEAWFAHHLLEQAPEKAPARMTRAELEEEAARLGLRGVDEAGEPVFHVAPGGDDLVNADFARAIEERRVALAAMVWPAPEETDNEAPVGAAAEDGEG